MLEVMFITQHKQHTFQLSLNPQSTIQEFWTCIKTHDSESRGQEAQQRDHRVSYLHIAPPSNSQTL